MVDQQISQRSLRSVGYSANIVASSAHVRIQAGDFLLVLFLPQSEVVHDLPERG
jgi:hypothetical protein